MAKHIPVKLVIFDLGGVIMHGGYLDFLKHYCLKCMTPMGKKEMFRLEREVNLGYITENQFYSKIRKIFDVHLSPREMHDLIVKKMQRDRGLIHMIPKLKKAKVALFSNSIGHMAPDVLRLRRLPIRKLFTRVFISSQMHMVKPDALAYRFVLRKMRVKPRQALMVDDRLENIRGARKIGMQGIVYKNSRQFRKAMQKYELV